MSTYEDLHLGISTTDTFYSRRRIGRGCWWERGLGRTRERMRREMEGEEMEGVECQGEKEGKGGKRGREEDEDEDDGAPPAKKLASLSLRG